MLCSKLKKKRKKERKKDCNVFKIKETILVHKRRARK